MSWEAEVVRRSSQAPRKMLKWAGSKSNAASQIRQYLDLDRPYIEPFCGSAAFYFEYAPEKAILNDLNSHLIDCYKSVKKSPSEVWRYYDSIEISESAYYDARSKFNTIDRSDLKSALFMYLNHFSFNGIYRTNRSGLFNTPYGAKKKIKRKFSLDDFIYFSRMLQRVDFRSMDFEVFLDGLEPRNACVYMDPPYFTVEGRVFNEYNARAFLADDLARLYAVAQRLAKNNLVVISYKDCREFRELFSSFLVAPFMVTRNVGGFAGRRKSDVELLAVLGG